MSVRQH